LGDEPTKVVSQGEDYLKPQLLGVVPAITGNSHRCLHLPVSPQAGFGGILYSPVFDFVRVENNHPFALVPLPSCFILGILRLFPRGSLSLPADAVFANLDFASLLWLDLFTSIALDLGSSPFLRLDPLASTLNVGGRRSLASLFPGQPRSVGGVSGAP
jgi:hypothetical protein